MRRGLIPWLAGIDPDSKTPRRNIARRSDIPREAAPLIDLLVEERLLSRDTRVTRDPQTGDEIRELQSSQRMRRYCRQWGLLDGWLEDDFSLLTTLEGVKRATRDWDANARGKLWLAHQGQRLAEAQALDARPDIAARLDAADRAYLAGSRARQEAARAEAEQRRREREEQQARQLADARKIARRTFIGAAVAFAFAFAAGAFGRMHCRKRRSPIRRPSKPSPSGTRPMQRPKKPRRKGFSLIKLRSKRRKQRGRPSARQRTRLSKRPSPRPQR